ncbi:hypothetical protein SSKA14_1482 [Stenotrophomonas sp. SKA14]|nr:hypothetical protein SSKA14_1482 [Stenotrophomonas sp. SKA14]
MNAHLVEKVGILTPGNRVSQRVIRTLRRPGPTSVGGRQLAMLQCIG